MMKTYIFKTFFVGSYIRFIHSGLYKKVISLIITRILAFITGTELLL